MFGKVSVEPEWEKDITEANQLEMFRFPGSYALLMREGVNCAIPMAPDVRPSYTLTCVDFMRKRSRWITPLLLDRTQYQAKAYFVDFVSRILAARFGFSPIPQPPRDVPVKAPIVFQK